MSGKQIVRVQIENFQSHVRTVFDPAPGLTVITGPSHEGKSAVLRALRWLYRNEPTGKDFIRAGTSMARVQVMLADGTEVTRERSASGHINRYIIERVMEEPKVLDGIGRGVPGPVQEVLGVRTVTLGGESVDLGHAGQLDGPFLLTANGSTRAEAVGRLTGAHLLQEASVDAAREEEAAKRESRQAAEQVDQLESRLAGYADLPAQEAALAALDAELERAETARVRLLRLRELRQRFREVTGRLQDLDRTLDRLGDLPAWEGRLRHLHAQYERRAALRRLAARWAGQVAHEQSVATVLRQAANVEQLAHQVAAAQVLSDRLRTAVRLRQRYEQTEQRLQEAEQIVRATVRVEDAARTVTEITEQQQRLGRLRVLRDRWQQLMAPYERASALVEQTRSLAEAEAAAVTAARLAERRERLQGFRTRIADWKQRMKPILQTVQEQNRALQAAQIEYEAALQEAGTCPTCGQTINAAVLHSHVQGRSTQSRL